MILFLNSWIDCTPSCFGIVLKFIIGEGGWEAVNGKGLFHCEHLAALMVAEHLARGFIFVKVIGLHAIQLQNENGPKKLSLALLKFQLTVSEGAGES